MMYKIYSTCPRPPSRAPPWSCPSSAADSCNRPTHTINQSNIYPTTHADIASQDIHDIVIQAYPNVSTRGTDNSPQTLISINFLT